MLDFDSYEEQYAITTESLDRSCSSSKQDPLDKSLWHQNQFQNKFEEVLDIFDKKTIILI